MATTKTALQTFALPSLALLPKEDSGNAQSISVPALVMVEGKHTGMSGNARTYSRSFLQQIVVASNDRLSKGLRCKIFASFQDHGYSQSATIGYVSGQFELKSITTELLPHPGMTELIGKLGIFCEVAIAGEANVQQYHDGRLKELSVGIDFGGEFAGVKNAIYEISAVAFPAVTGAALYADTPTQERYTLEDLLMMIESAIASGAIDGANPEVMAIVEAAKGMMETPADPPAETAAAPTGDTAAMSQPNSGTDTYHAKIAALEEQVALYQRKQVASDRFSQLRQKGEALRGDGKLSPAAFNDLLGTPDLEKFSAVGSTELDRIEFYLTQVEKYASPVSFGLQTSNEPLPEQAIAQKAATDEAKDYLERNTVKAPY